jgi:hypothetical protein
MFWQASFSLQNISERMQWNDNTIEIVNGVHHCPAALKHLNHEDRSFKSEYLITPTNAPLKSKIRILYVTSGILLGDEAAIFIDVQSISLTIALVLSAKRNELGH